MPVEMEQRLKKYLYRYYEDVASWIDEEEVEEIGPIGEETVMEHIRIGSVIVGDSCRRDRIEFHVEGSCDWEPEHGLEITISDDKILYVGPYEDYDPNTQRLSYALEHYGYYDPDADPIMNYADKETMFRDFGFKLIVINSLLDKETSFASSLREMEKRYTEDYEYGTYQCIPEMMKYFKELILTEDDLAQVTSLSFDGGNSIYCYIMPDWDGESDEFDVYSVEDYVLLPNLKEVWYTAMCNPYLMDVFRENGIAVR